MTNSILLTGGFGNLGGRFSAHLHNIGDAEITLATRRPRTAPPWAPKAKVRTCDLVDLESLKRACQGIDTIFHFAALNDRQCLSDPITAHQTNVIGTANLINAAISCGVRHIVYMSTIHVYGAPLIGHIDESCPTKPSHPYGLTHLEAETVIRERSTEISSTIIRSGNGFGLPMTADVDIWHIIVNDLCVQAVRDKKLVLKSPSNTERNFITIQDICRALHFVGVESTCPSSSVTFNLGSIQSRTLREMSELVAKQSLQVLGSRPEIVETVERSVSETKLDFDSTALRSRGFSTQEDFEVEIEGILKLVKKTYVEK